jgi:hypothetical protein
LWKWKSDACSTLTLADSVTFLPHWGAWLLPTIKIHDSWFCIACTNGNMMLWIWQFTYSLLHGLKQKIVWKTGLKFVKVRNVNDECWTQCTNLHFTFLFIFFMKIYIIFFQQRERERRSGSSTRLSAHLFHDNFTLTNEIKKTKKKREIFLLVICNGWGSGVTFNYIARSHTLNTYILLH